MATVKIIGTAVPRSEGPDKVSGRTIYAADIQLDGMLWGKILRSPYPHARIRRIDASKASRVPGVRAVVTGQDVPGHYMGKMIRDMPVLCWDLVRFVGDRVAAVAAETLEAAEEALAMIAVDYEPLPAVFDPLEAIRRDAPLLHEDVSVYEGAPRERLALDVHNGLTRLAWRKGDIVQGFRKADLTLEHTFRVPARHQGYLEPHAGVLSIGSEGHIQVWASTKDPFRTRRMLAETIRVPQENIRVNVVNVGGEFGAKGDARDLPVAYFLAREAKRPVKIVMTYAEELAASNPDQATVVTIKTGVKHDGRIMARQLRALHASGAYGALKANASLATWHYAGGLYQVEHSSFEFLQIYTNTVPGGYYRSPGSIPTFFAVESHTDIIARELGMDPALFRLKNLITEGGEDAIGKRLSSVHFREVLEKALDAGAWRQPKAGAHHGRGVAIYGRHISGGETGIAVTAEPDGTFTVLSPTVDQGAGTHTILRQLVAEQMQVDLQDVRVVVGHTDIAPYDTGARASRVTYAAGRAVVRACEQLRTDLAADAARILECLPEGLVFEDGFFLLEREPSQRVSLRRIIAQRNRPLTVTIQEDFPYPDTVTYVCAQVAEVEVDPESGAVRLHRMVTAHDVGTIINPLTHQGQIDGGVVMGLGQGLMEELVMDNGKVINANLGDYKLPTIADTPRLETILVESAGGLAPYEAKAIGEFANNSPPAAIANAVADAVGVRLFQIPITAENVYRALAEKPTEVNALTGVHSHDTR